MNITIGSRTTTQTQTTPLTYFGPFICFLFFCVRLQTLIDSFHVEGVPVASTERQLTDGCEVDFSVFRSLCALTAKEKNTKHRLNVATFVTTGGQIVTDLIRVDFNLIHIIHII